jgi:hypothetical protein
MDTPLTPLGLEQARRNAALLRSQIGDPSGFSLVSSPLGRARKTAEIIGEALALKPSFDPRLVEIGLGRWDGLTVDQINERVPGAWDRSRLDASLFSAPEGETFESVAERLSASLVELKRPPSWSATVYRYGFCAACSCGSTAPASSACSRRGRMACSDASKARWISWSRSPATGYRNGVKNSSSRCAVCSGSSSAR